MTRIALTLLACLVLGRTARGGDNPYGIPVLPIGGDGTLACVVYGDRVLVAGKGEHGRTVTAAVGRVAHRLGGERTRLVRRLKHLRGNTGEDVASERTLLQQRKAEIARQLADLKNCRAGRVDRLRGRVRSFRFVCLHAFRAPTAMAGDRDCAIDMRKAFYEATDSAPAAVVPLTPGVVRIFDQSLRDACAREGGTYLRNLNLSEFYPLYHGGCQAPGTTLHLTQIEQQKVIVSLQMEDESNNCFTIARTTPVDSAGVKDPCDCYDPDAPRGGGGGEDTRPAPAPSDCRVLQMDEESKE